MGFFKEVWSQAQTGAKFAYEWSPIGLQVRAVEAVTEAIADKVTNKADVAVISWGSDPLSTSMDWMELASNRADEIVYEPSSVADMVEKVLAKTGDRTLRKLNINGHGRTGDQNVGKENLGVATPDGETWLDPSLAKLSAVMDKDTVTTLSGCNVGEGDMGEQLLRSLAKLWGSEVRAATTYQNSVGSGLQGPVLACRPEGDDVKCIRAFDESLLSIGWLLE